MLNSRDSGNLDESVGYGGSGESGEFDGSGEADESGNSGEFGESGGSDRPGIWGRVKKTSRTARFVTQKLSGKSA